MADRFALLLKLNKIHPVGIVSPAMYAEFIKGELVQGYMKLTQTDYAWHIWVEKDGVQYDMNRLLYQLYNNRDKEMDIRLYKVVPEKCNIQKIDSIVAEWDLYNKDTAEFWKSVSYNIRETKSKIFKGLK